MKIALISPFPDIHSYGLRIISACLKRAGHQVTVYFLLRPFHGSSMAGYPRTGYASVMLSESETRSLLESLAEMTKESGLIGISVMSNFVDQVIQITRFLHKKNGGPVIWGGVHPTVKPEMSLEHADLICVGEGEEAVVELAEKLEHGNDFHDVRNIWFKKGEKIVRGELRPLIQDLDNLPMQDFDCQSHFVWTDTGFRLLKCKLEFLLRDSTLEKKKYLTMLSRGCCFACTYCCNNSFNKLYKGQKIIRKRSVDNVISELRVIKEKYPFVEMVQFDDDAFSYVFNLEEVRDLAKKFREDIGLELFVTGIAPPTIDREKFRSLIDAGMTATRMGIQTCNERTLKLYDRKQTNQQVMDGALIINEFKDRLFFVQYDIILDNPWEREGDLVDTLILLNRLPAPFLLCLQSLTFFPGTELYQRASAEGRIRDEYEDIYRKHYSRPEQTYINNLFWRIRASKARGCMAKFVGGVRHKDIAMWRLSALKNNVLRSLYKKWVVVIETRIMLILKGFRRLLGMRAR